MKPSTTHRSSRAAVSFAFVSWLVACFPLAGAETPGQKADVQTHFAQLGTNTTSPMWTSDYQDYVRSLSKDTDYRTVDGAGHFLMLEKPKEFNAVLMELLRKYHLTSGH